MLFWVKFFSGLLFLIMLSLNLFLSNLLSLILVLEFLIFLIFLIMTFSGVIFNLNWLFGFSFIVIVLGGLEIALGFLLVNL